MFWKTPEAIKDLRRKIASHQHMSVLAGQELDAKVRAGEMNAQERDRKMAARRTELTRMLVELNTIKRERGWKGWFE